MSNIAFEITAIFLLLLANGIFAMSEIAIVTARKSRLQELANKGVARARVALNLANNPNAFLSTVQIGITGSKSEPAIHIKEQLSNTEAGGLREIYPFDQRVVN